MSGSLSAMPTVANHPASILRLTGCSKTFGSRTVLDSVELVLEPGEVHALVGHNGSGKSTLIKILAGFYSPDDGAQLEVAGMPVSMPFSSDEAKRLGLAFIHQDLALNEQATVLENLCAGRFPTRKLAPLRWRRQRDWVRGVLARADLPEVEPDSPVLSLSAVQRTLLAIARATEDLASGAARVLVLDEPTVYLPADGIERLFDLVRRLTDRGLSVLFVSHDLDEVGDISDRVTVLRDGRRIATRETSSTPKPLLARMILGSDLGARYPRRVPPMGGPLAQVKGLSGKVLRPLSMSMDRGEIIGITGLLGSGQDELPYLLFGAQPATAGTVTIRGASMHSPRMTPVQARRMGMALVPANRLADGAIGEATAAENVIMLTLGRHTRWGRLLTGSMLERGGELLKQFEVRPFSPSNPFASFSGGNQQKLVLAKWLETKPDVIVLHEPTQGVDIGSRRQLHAHLTKAAEDGCTVIISSTEYEDLANLCHRVLVLARGEIVADLRGADLSHRSVLEACYGGPINRLKERSLPCP